MICLVHVHSSGFIIMFSGQGEGKGREGMAAKLEDLVNSLKFLSSTDCTDHPIRLLGYLHFSSCFWSSVMELCCKCSLWVDPPECSTVGLVKFLSRSNISGELFLILYLVFCIC